LHFWWYISRPTELAFTRMQLSPIADAVTEEYVTPPPHLATTQLGLNRLFSSFFQPNHRAIKHLHKPHMAYWPILNPHAHLVAA
jgi:hypothetical protein